VTAGSRFFRSGGVDLAIGGEGVDVDMPGVRTLLQGAIAFTSPTPGSGRPAGAEATFSLHESREAAARAFTGPPVAYAIRFPGAAGALDEGAPVRMAGIRVGRVRQVALEIDPAAGRVATPVVIELDPAKLNVAIDDGEPGEDAADPTSRLNQAMRQLIQQGLRAQLSDAGLILGGRQIELVMTDQTGVAAFDLGDTPPRIPAIRAAGLTETLASLGDVAQSVQSITADIEDIPLRRIGGDLAEAVDRINQLSARLRDVAGSQQVDQAVQRLNQTLANLRSLSQTADQRVEPIMESAQSATQAIESAADALASVTGGSVRDQHDIEALVEELIRTARSVRSLTDYLSRNPEALLQGMEE
jgi:paraquat-inducible protein B